MYLILNNLLGILKIIINEVLSLILIIPYFIYDKSRLLLALFGADFFHEKRSFKVKIKMINSHIGGVMSDDEILDSVINSVLGFCIRDSYVYTLLTQIPFIILQVCAVIIGIPTLVCTMILDFIFDHSYLNFIPLMRDTYNVLTFPIRAIPWGLTALLFEKLEKTQSRIEMIKGNKNLIVVFTPRGLSLNDLSYFKESFNIYFSNDKTFYFPEVDNEANILFISPGYDTYSLSRLSSYCCDEINPYLEGVTRLTFVGPSLGGAVIPKICTDLANNRFASNQLMPLVDIQLWNTFSRFNDVLHHFGIHGMDLYLGLFWNFDNDKLCSDLLKKDYCSSIKQFDLQNDKVVPTHARIRLFDNSLTINKSNKYRQLTLNCGGYHNGYWHNPKPFMP